MDEYLDQNLSALGHSDPELVKELAGVAMPPWEPVEARKGGYTLKLGEHHLHSPYDPRREALRLVEGKAEVLHIHFGLGLGHLLEADAASADGAILILEPSRELVLTTLRITPLAHLLHAKRAVLCCTLARFVQMLGMLLKAERPYRFTALPFHEQAFPSLLNQVKEYIKVAVYQSRIALRTLTMNSEYLTMGSFKGLAYTTQLPGVQHLEQRFAGKPAVVISAGPSLDGNLVDLLPYGDRCLLIAISRTARPLELLGMRPHILVHNEPKPFYSFIEGCGNLDRTAFVLALQAEAAYYQHPHGQTFVFQNPLDFAGSWINGLYPGLQKGVLDSGGSVSTEAFSLAVLAGCNPIILIGQDLATKAGRYYAQGENNRNFMHSAHDALEVPGYFGVPVPSLSTYYNFAQWLGIQALSLKQSHPELRLINATEGGVMIAGFQNMKLRDAAWRYFREPFEVSAELAGAARVANHEVLPAKKLDALWARTLDKLSTIDPLSESLSDFATHLHSAVADDCPQEELRALEAQLDGFKARYITLSKGLEVLNGLMQAELLGFNRQRRERIERKDATELEKLRVETEDFHEVLQITQRASGTLRKLLLELRAAKPR